MTNEDAKHWIEICVQDYIRYYDDYPEEILEARNMMFEAIDAQPMRDATEEERKSVKDYIESISKPTGVRFDAQLTDAKETIIKSALKYLVKMQIEEGSVGIAVDNDPDHDCYWDELLAWLEAQPCKDKIGDFINHKIDYLEDLASIETNEGRWREEEKYLYAISVLEEVVEFINTGGCEE